MLSSGERRQKNGSFSQHECAISWTALRELEGQPFVKRPHEWESGGVLSNVLKLRGDLRLLILSRCTSLGKAL